MAPTEKAQGRSEANPSCGGIAQRDGANPSRPNSQNPQGQALPRRQPEEAEAHGMPL